MLRLLCATGISMAAAVVPATAGELGAVDIRRELVGPSIRWWAEDTWLRGDLQLAPDGRAAITSESPMSADEGRWRLVGDELCTTWGKTRGGAEKCYRIRQIDGRRFVTSGGNVFEILEPGA